jgi:hypothetical protein
VVFRRLSREPDPSNRPSRTSQSADSSVLVCQRSFLVVSVPRIGPSRQNEASARPGCGQERRLLSRIERCRSGVIFRDGVAKKTSPRGNRIRSTRSANRVLEQERSFLLESIAAGAVLLCLPRPVHEPRVTVALRGDGTLLKVDRRNACKHWVCFKT